MQEQTKIEETVENIKEYIHIRYELLTLHASDKISHVSSEIFSRALIASVCILSVLLLSFSAAFYISTLKGGSYTFGFLIVGGAYLVIALIMICFRKKFIARPFRNKMIRDFFNN
ncbi:MAG: phage holin family protein [Bacteroidia bacterium]|nr:phage holin family protein [Bacteroidia bacterium]